MRILIKAALATVGVGLVWAGRQLWQDKQASGQSAPNGKAGASRPAKAQQPGPSDDLTRISGLGPKAARVLADAGVTTFSQLAAMDAVSLKKLLRYSVPGANPSTWPAQAAKMT